MANRLGKKMNLRTVMIAAASVLVVITAGAILASQIAGAAPEQPIPYSHKTHVEAGVECLYCHSGAARSARATIPNIDKCLGCHKSIANDTHAIQGLSRLYDRGGDIGWQRVSEQPEFVYFTHRKHLSASLNCETCHGDVASMDWARQTVEMDMGWCLDCHMAQDESRVAHLADCLTCHK